MPASSPDLLDQGGDITANAHFLDTCSFVLVTDVDICVDTWLNNSLGLFVLVWFFYCLPQSHEISLSHVKSNRDARIGLRITNM